MKDKEWGNMEDQREIIEIELSNSKRLEEQLKIQRNRSKELVETLKRVIDETYCLAPEFEVHMDAQWNVDETSIECERCSWCQARKVLRNYGVNRREGGLNEPGIA